MSRIAKTTASLLTIAALAPAASLAADNELRGAPQLRVAGEQSLSVNFVVDDRLGSSGAKVTVVGLGSAGAKAVKAAGKHGNDFKYRATVKTSKQFEVGRKYTVKLTIDGETVQRLAVLKAAK
jgi:hypothetical protein